MKTTIKELTIPKPKGGTDVLCMDDFATKGELESLKDAVYKLHFDKDEVTEFHPFYIQSLEDENDIYVANGHGIIYTSRIHSNIDYVEYSLNGTWHKLSEVDKLTLNKDERVYLRCVGIDYLKPAEHYVRELSLLYFIPKNFLIGGDLRSIIGNAEDVDSGYSYLFYEQSKLVSAKRLRLNIKRVGTEGCKGMFECCTSLIDAPELTATYVGGRGYSSMFSRCTSLVIPPTEVKAEKLGVVGGIYIGANFEYMFRECTSLTTAPELPATKLAEGCYNSMFYGCTSLNTAPELPATKLAYSCYSHMFCNCTSLTTAPAILPATTLAGICYQYMFYGCTSLVNAPELPATTLAEGCYNSMFNGCTSLNKIKCDAEVFDINLNSTGEWMEGVSPTGKFVKAKGVEWSSGVSGIPEGWEVDEWDDYFYIEAMEDSGETIRPALMYHNAAVCEYTTNKIDWSVVSSGLSLPSQKGLRYYFRCISGTCAKTESDTTPLFYTRALVKIGGDLDKVMYPYTLDSVELTSFCYSRLFTWEDAPCRIGDASDLRLPTETLADYCYENMFRGCTSLTTAPELPATTLALCCYGWMFYGCTSLTTAPALPATTLASSCYNGMFYACSKLNEVKCNAVTFAADSTYFWLDGVAPEGTFYQNVEAEWPSGSSGIPYGWMQLVIE